MRAMHAWLKVRGLLPASLFPSRRVQERDSWRSYRNARLL
jgi:hypothetical protein